MVKHGVVHLIRNHLHLQTFDLCIRWLANPSICMAVHINRNSIQTPAMHEEFQKKTAVYSSLKRGD